MILNSNNEKPKLGILILDRKYPLFIGNVGNPLSYDFPVLVQKIDGLYNPPTPPIYNNHNELIKEAQLFINSAINLQKTNVNVIISSCGFFALMQQEVSKILNIPVLTSPLLLIPILLNIIPQKQKIGVITLYREYLTPEYFKAVGVEDTSRILLSDMSNANEFKKMIEKDSVYVDERKIREEILRSVDLLINSDSNIGVLVIECSDMPPYSNDIRKLTKLPVYDYFDLIKIYLNTSFKYVK